MGTCHVLVGISYITLKKKRKSSKQTRKQTPLLLSHPLKLLYLPRSSSVLAKDWQLAMSVLNTMHIGAFLSPNAGIIFIHSNKVNFVAEISQNSTNICKLDVLLCNSPTEVTESFCFIWSFSRDTGPFFCPCNPAKFDLDHQRALLGLFRGPC